MPRIPAPLPGVIRAVPHPATRTIIVKGTKLKVPADATDDLLNAIRTLHAATRRAITCVQSLELYRALTRLQEQHGDELGEALTGSIEALTVVTLRDLTVAITGLHDDDAKAINVRKVIGEVCKPAHRPALERFHAVRDPAYDLGAALAALTLKARRLKKPSVRKALVRVKDVRDKMVAHYDMNPDFANGHATIRDIGLALAATGSALYECNLVALARPYDVRRIRATGRDEARVLVETLLAGVEARDT